MALARARLGVLDGLVERVELRMERRADLSQGQHVKVRGGDKAAAV